MNLSMEHYCSQVVSPESLERDLKKVIGKQANTIETGVAHAFDDLIDRAQQHMAPVASQFDWPGQQCRSLLGSGEKAAR